MQEYAKYIARWVLSTFRRVSAKKTICLYPETMPRNRPKFRESLREGNLRTQKYLNIPNVTIHEIENNNCFSV